MKKYFILLLMIGLTCSCATQRVAGTKSGKAFNKSHSKNARYIHKKSKKKCKKVIRFHF